MAIQTRRGISGMVGLTVFRIVNGQQVIQAAAQKGNVKQTVATKESSGLMALSSSLGKAIREHHVKNTGALFDKMVASRLTGILNKEFNKNKKKGGPKWTFSTKTLYALNAFDFNIGSLVKKSFTVEPHCSLIDNELLITLTEIDVLQDIAFPSDCEQCSIRLMVSYYNVNSGSSQSSSERAEIKVTKADVILEAQDFKFAVPAGCFAVATLSLHFTYVNKKETVNYNNADFFPSRICGVLYNDGEFLYEHDKHWLKSGHQLK